MGFLSNIKTIANRLSKYSQVFAAGTLLASWSAYHLLDSHSVLADRELHESLIFHADGYIKPTFEFEDLFYKVCKTSPFSPSQLSNVHLTISGRFQPSTAGHLPSTSASTSPIVPRSFIQIPFWLNMDYMDGGLRSKMWFHNHVLPVDWTSDEGKELAQYLRIDEKAMKFLLARQLFYLNSNQNMVRFASMSTLGYLVYQSMFLLKRYLQFATQPLSIRIIVLQGICIVAGLIHYQLMGAYRIRLDLNVDRKAAQLGSDYLDGGISYYHNTKNWANRALYKCWPDAVADYIEPHGNEKSSFFKPITTSSIRLSKLSLLRDQQNRQAKEFQKTSPSALPS